MPKREFNALSCDNEILLLHWHHLEQILCCNSAAYCHLLSRLVEDGFSRPFLRGSGVCFASSHCIRADDWCWNTAVPYEYSCSKQRRRMDTKLSGTQTLLYCTVHSPSKFERGRSSVSCRLWRIWFLGECILPSRCMYLAGDQVVMKADLRLIRVS